MTEYRWEIVKLDVAPAKRGFADVVRAIHWRYIATEGEGADEVVAEMTGSTPLPLPVDSEGYTAYATVTEQWCIDMVLAYLELEEIQQHLAAVVAQLRDTTRTREITPPFVNPGRLATEGERVLRRWRAPGRAPA